MSAAWAALLWPEPQGGRELRGGEHPDGVRIPVLKQSGAFDRHLGLGDLWSRQAVEWACRLWGERGLDGLGRAVQVLAWRQWVWLVRVWRPMAWRPWDELAEPLVSTEQTRRSVQLALAG